MKTKSRSVSCLNLLTLIVVLLIGISCKKEYEPVNIVLYNKPLKTIQQAIQGKWKMAYAKGGLCGSCIYDCKNCSVEFTTDNRVISNSFVIANGSKIDWVKGVGTYTDIDSTFLMNFSDKDGVPWQYVVERIYNDTLIYHDNSSDAVFYHYTKIK